MNMIPSIRVFQILLIQETMGVLLIFSLIGLSLASEAPYHVACRENCLPQDGALTCNETTYECLHGCQEGFVGQFCDIVCISHCSNCTINTNHANSITKAHCHECQRDYYRHEGKCEKCNEQCLRNSSSPLPVCKEADGRCEFGCNNGYHGITCNNTCSATCRDNTCDQISETTKTAANEPHITESMTIIATKAPAIPVDTIVLVSCVGGFVIFVIVFFILIVWGVAKVGSSF